MQTILKRQWLVRLGFLAAALVLACWVAVRAQVPELVKYQGRLTLNGNLYSGPATIILTLYASSSGGPSLSLAVLPWAL